MLGVFVFWKKMAYFGDSLSHSSLLGMLLGILYGIHIDIGIFFICLVFIVALLWVEHKNIIGIDTILGILAHFALSSAIIILSIYDDIQIDLHSILFGNILSVDIYDIYLMSVVCIVIAFFVYLYWDKFLLITIDKNLAQAEGVNVLFYNIVIMVFIAFTVAIAFEIIGALLITSMLVIPPAIAVYISSSPIKMVINSILIGIFCVILSITTSSMFDIPSGASIVVCMSILFLMVSIIFSFKNK
jgi:zinc transport system permease protein